MKKTPANKLTRIFLVMLLSCSAIFVHNSFTAPEISPSLTVNAGDNELPFVPVNNEVKNRSSVSAVKVQAGSRVVLTGSATGGSGKYTYSYYYKRKAAAKWTTLAENTASTTAYVSLGKTETYMFRIVVKDSKGLSAKKIFYVDVLPKLINTSAVNASKLLVGAKVCLSGAAEGGEEPYCYTYQYQKPGKTSWITLGEKYGTAATAHFTPKAAGTYKARVLVKDSNGTLKSSVFTIDVMGELLVNNSTINATTVTLGNKLTITAKTTGGTEAFYYTYEYKAPDASKWTTIGKRNSTNTNASFTPASTGIYETRVYIKDASGFVTVKNFKVAVK